MATETSCCATPRRSSCLCVPIAAGAGLSSGEHHEHRRPEDFISRGTEGGTEDGGEARGQQAVEQGNYGAMDLCRYEAGSSNSGTSTSTSGTSTSVHLPGSSAATPLHLSGAPFTLLASTSCVRAFLSARVDSEPSERERPAARNRANLLSRHTTAAAPPPFPPPRCCSTSAAVVLDACLRQAYPPAVVRLPCPLHYPGGSLSLHFSLVDPRSASLGLLFSTISATQWASLPAPLLHSSWALRRPLLVTWVRTLGQREALDGLQTVADPKTHRASTEQQTQRGRAPLNTLEPFLDPHHSRQTWPSRDRCP
ncbi:hypothetical protein PMIN01_06617 [Paraphaeosphaeria minitans]|uniref:Uncharacterized protein n=1 Tax=Paraphaeosphaeria minitans TaxID=565426 RepID=A0A9P6GGA6_9PLEO|nr:hypothetical protein PMIN01_06617 [Paraphaeosphaeria minitans]